jgi:polyribonucleotide nucleotidyltransferase
MNMIELDAREVSEEVLKEAFELGAQECDRMCDMQTQFCKLCTITPKEIMYNKPSESLMSYIHGILQPHKLEALKGNTKVSFNDLYYQYEKEVLEVCKDQIADHTNTEFSESKVKIGVFNAVKYFIRDLVLEKDTRIDERPLDQVRPLYCEVGVLPRVHGSGLFWRGQTQVLTTATLGSVGDGETTDSMEEDKIEKHYMHHYNMHPFATNEPQ